MSTVLLLWCICYSPLCRQVLVLLSRVELAVMLPMAAHVGTCDNCEGVGGGGPWQAWTKLVAWGTT